MNLAVLGAEIRSFAGLSLNPCFGFKLCLRGFAYRTLSHQSLPVCLSAWPEKNEHQLPGLCKQQKDEWLCFLPGAQRTTHSILAQRLPFPTYSFFREVEATKWGKCLDVYWVATTFIQTLAHPFAPSLRWRLPSQKKVYFSGLFRLFTWRNSITPFIRIFNSHFHGDTHSSVPGHWVALSSLCSHFCWRLAPLYHEDMSFLVAYSQLSLTNPPVCIPLLQCAPVISGAIPGSHRGPLVPTEMVPKFEL